MHACAGTYRKSISSKHEPMRMRRRKRKRDMAILSLEITKYGRKRKTNK